MVQFDPANRSGKFIALFELAMLVDPSTANSFVGVNSRKCRSANALRRSFVTGQMTGRGNSPAPGGFETLEAAANTVLWEGWTGFA